MEIDMMSSKSGHDELKYETVQEFEQDAPSIDFIHKQLQAGWILSMQMSQGQSQMIANQNTDKDKLVQIVKQLNPQKLIMKPPITAG